MEKRRDPSHVRSVPERQWVAFLEAAGLTVIDQGLEDKVRPWEEWTGRTRMTPDDRAALDRHVLAAPQHCRDAFRFVVADGRIESFTDRMLLVRADRD